MKHLIFTLLLLASTASQAALITISADKNVVEVGEKINISILASKFNPADAFNLFNFDLVLHSSLFSYDVPSLSSSLPMFTPPNSFGLSVVQNSNMLSFGFLDLVPYTLDKFALANFTITALQTGVSPFSYSSDLNLGQGFFAPLSIFPTDVQVTSNTKTLVVRSSTEVSAPNISLAFCLLILILVLRRQHR